MMSERFRPDRLLGQIPLKANSSQQHEPVKIQFNQVADRVVVTVVELQKHKGLRLENPTSQSTVPLTLKHCAKKGSMLLGLMKTPVSFCRMAASQVKFMPKPSIKRTALGYVVIS